MKTKRIAAVTVPDSEQELYPYPQWSPTEIEKLWRWYPVVGLKQCVELWVLLTGRERSISQIENKANRAGIQSYIPDDWFELFDE